MKAAIYCRVSTDDQEREGTSLQTQMESCLRYCEGKGYEASQRFSEAYSGLTLDRPKLEELRELVRSGKVDIVVIYCLDRLSRNATHGVILRDELEKHMVKLESVTEDIDKSALGEAITYLRGTFAQIEAEKIKERTMRGKKARMSDGKLPQGTGVGIYGYDWNKETKRREINLYETEIIREIFNRVAAGEKFLSIARDLNARGVPTKATIISSNPDDRKYWHTLTIRRVIRNSSYIGQTYFKDTLLPAVTPAIVTEEVFQAANAELDKPKVRTGQPKHDYLLRNHAYCALCGKPLVGHCLNKKYRYYQCSSARPYENRKQECNARYIRADDLENAVWNSAREVVSKPDIVLAEIQRQLSLVNDDANIESIDDQIQELEKKLKQYEQRCSNLLEALELGEFEKDEILDRLNKVKRLRHEDEAKLENLQKMRDNLANLANAQVKLGQLYDRVMENLQNCTPELKKLLFDALDIKVYASNDRTEIQGVIPLELALPTTARTLA